MTKGLPYTYSCTLSWGGDEPTAELDIECSYSVEWGTPESGRFGKVEDYEPGEADMIGEIKILTVNGKRWPVDLSYGFQTSEQDHAMLVEKLENEHDEDMISSAADIEVGYADDAADARYERMRMDGY